MFVEELIKKGSYWNSIILPLKEGRSQESIYCCGCAYDLTLAVYFSHEKHLYCSTILNLLLNKTSFFASMDSSANQHHQQQHGHDPSQTSSYDQSSHPCYPYSNSKDNNTNTYAQDNQAQFREHPNSIPIAPEPPHSTEPSHSHALNPVHPTPVQGSLNPAAVAAIAGALAQLVGNVDGLPRELVKRKRSVFFLLQSPIFFSHSQNYLFDS